MIKITNGIKVGQNNNGSASPITLQALISPTVPTDFFDSTGVRSGVDKTPEPPNQGDVYEVDLTTGSITRNGFAFVPAAGQFYTNNVNDGDTVIYTRTGSVGTTIVDKNNLVIKGDGTFTDGTEFQISGNQVQFFGLNFDNASGPFIDMQFDCEDVSVACLNISNSGLINLRGLRPIVVDNLIQDSGGIGGPVGNVSTNATQIDGYIGYNTILRYTTNGIRLDGPNSPRVACAGASNPSRDINFTIENNRIINNDVTTVGPLDGITMKSGGNLVRNNYLENIRANGIDVRWGHNNVIYANWIQNARFDAIRMNGGDEGGNVVVWNYGSFTNGFSVRILPQTCIDDGIATNNPDIGAFNNTVRCNFFDGYEQWLFVETDSPAGFSGIPSGNTFEGNFYRGLNDTFGENTFQTDVSDWATFEAANTIDQQIVFTADQATVSEYKNSVNVEGVNYSRPSFFDSLIQEA